MNARNEADRIELYDDGRGSRLSGLAWCVLVLGGCSGAGQDECAPIDEPRADDEPVSGVTVDAVVAALEAQPFAALPIEWRDGPTTTATSSLEVVRGTGRRFRGTDCIAACNNPKYGINPECTPDELWVDARGIASTLDGRVVDAAWTGSLIATVWDGPLVWTVSPEPIPATELEGTLDLIDVAELPEGFRDVGLRVSMQGTDGTLDWMSFEASSIQGRKVYGLSGRVSE